MNEWLALGIVILLLYALSILVAVGLIVFLAVILIRALAFKPKAQPKADQPPVDFDKEAAVDSLRELVICKPVSYMDPALEDAAEFEKLISKLPTLYPAFSRSASSPACPTAVSCFAGRARPRARPPS